MDTTTKRCIYKGEVKEEEGKEKRNKQARTVKKYCIRKTLIIAHVMNKFGKKETFKDFCYKK